MHPADRTVSHLPVSLRRRPLASALLLAITMPMAVAAAADEPTKTFDTVQVTGATIKRASSPKFTAPLLDTPQTVTVVPADVFNAQGAQNLSDVLKNTPGISFNAGENVFGSNSNNFSLRGFDTSGSIFIDGVRDSGSYTRDVFNIEQVEVAKGPAADNGRGGLGGYVNMVSKTPQLDDFARATFSVGADATDADSRVRASADLNQQLGQSSALRLNVLGKDGGVAGRQYVQSDAVGIAPSLAFGLGTATRFVIAGEYVSQSGRPDWGVPGAAVAGTIDYDADAARADRDNFYGLKSDFDDNTSRSINARIEHDISASVTISNLSRWSVTDRDTGYTIPRGYDADNRQVPTETVFYRRDNTTFANLTNLSADFATGTLQHTLSTGVEFTREESENDRFATIKQPATDVFNPDYLRAVYGKAAPTQTSQVQIDTVAAYAYDTIKFNQQWQLTGGLRAERYQVDIASRTADGQPQGPDGYRFEDTTLGGKLGLVFKPTSNGSIYASVNIATLPPGSYLSNPDISRAGDNAFPGLVGQNNQTAKPQRAVSQEIGVKWDFFDDRLYTSAAVFNTERRSVAVSGKEPGNADSPNVLRGYSKQVVRGLELSAVGRITEAWTVFAGAVWLDSKRELGEYLDAARCSDRPNDYQAGASTADCAAIVAGAGGVDGDELAFTPKQSASLWTTYTFANRLTVGGGVQYAGDSWAGRPDDADRLIPNGRYGKLPSYTVGNLMASYQFNDKFSLRLNIDNVTDKTYATSANWGVSRAFLGPARAYLLSADIRFW